MAQEERKGGREAHRGRQVQARAVVVVVLGPANSLFGPD